MENPRTEVVINYMEGSISLHIVSDDLEIYALAKRLDELSSHYKESGDSTRRVIFLEIEKSLLDKIVKE